MNLLLPRLSELVGRIQPEKRKKRLLPTKVLILFALLPLIYGIILSIIILSHETPGFRLEITQNCFVVSKVDKEINQIFENDIITNISGLEYHSVLSAMLPAIKTMEKSNAKLQNLTLIRNGIKKKISFKTVPITPTYYFKSIGPSLFFVFITTFLVLTTLLKSPVEQPADLVLLTLSLFSLLIINDFPYFFGIVNPKLLSFSFLSLVLIHWLAFSAWTHFTLQFPVERQFLTGRPMVVTAIYVVPPVVALGISTIATSGSGNFWGMLQHYKYWATPGLMTLTLIKNIIDYWKIKSPLEKSQLKLFICGIFTGIAPYIFLYLLPHIFIDKPLIPFNIVILFGILIPLTISLAIIRYKLMDVDQIISKGLTYIILILFLILAYSGFIVAIKQWLWGKGLLSQEVSILFIIFIALLFNPLKTRLQYQIDRIFLKDPLDYGILLHDFSNRIVKSIKLQDLVELLTEQFPTEFRIQKSILMISNDNWIRVYPKNSNLAEYVENQKKLMNALKETGEYLCVYDVTHSDAKNTVGIEILNSINCPLAFVLRGSNKIFGIFLLGNKANGKIYSKTEIQIFSTLANNASIAMENSLMYESIKESRDQIHQMFNKVAQAEKMAAIGEMTAVLTHEIRNPLAVIRSSAEFLKKKNREPQIQKELLTNILQEIDTLNIVVNNTLGLARYKPPEFRRLNIKEQIKQLIDQWSVSSEHRKNVNILFKKYDEIPDIYADEKQLSQVFINLVMNSEEAMPEGGEITIQVQDNTNEDGIKILFKDTGPGISQQQKNNIFKKFYTSKENGLGLGLAVCYQLINAHNGSIFIKNRNKDGVCATVCLPYRPYKKMPLLLNS